MKRFLITSIVTIVAVFILEGCVTCSQCPTCDLCLPDQVKNIDRSNDQTESILEHSQYTEITEEVLVRKSENPKTINP